MSYDRINDRLSLQKHSLSLLYKLAIKIPWNGLLCRSKCFNVMTKNAELMTATGERLSNCLSQAMRLKFMTKDVLYLIDFFFFWDFFTEFALLMRNTCVNSFIFNLFTHKTRNRDRNFLTSFCLDKEIERDIYIL